MTVSFSRIALLRYELSSCTWEINLFVCLYHCSTTDASYSVCPSLNCSKWNICRSRGSCWCEYSGQWSLCTQFFYHTTVAKNNWGNWSNCLESVYILIKPHCLLNKKVICFFPQNFILFLWLCKWGWRKLTLLSQLKQISGFTEQAGLKRDLLVDGLTQALRVATPWGIRSNLIGVGGSEFFCKPGHTAKVNEFVLGGFQFLKLQHLRMPALQIV